ncbi:siderophore ferric iron reductase [Marinomonas epiphytica]
MEQPIEQLFLESKALLPALEGWQLASSQEGDEQLLSVASYKPSLQRLHQRLKEAHPETGAPYWRVRSWGLTCWQPIYIALICVYHLGATPSSLSRLHQRQQGNYIAGYALPDGEWYQADHHKLIAYTAKHLAILFNTFSQAHIELFGGNQPLYQHLLADQIMDVVVRAASHGNQQQIIQEYNIWAQNLALPNVQEIQLQRTNQGIGFKRKSCCLHYRRVDGDVCANCPLTKKKTNNEALCLN